MAKRTSFFSSAENRTAFPQKPVALIRIDPPFDYGFLDKHNGEKYYPPIVPNGGTEVV
jgi:hypothetical protein